jgi:hypothetical protein
MVVARTLLLAVCTWSAAAQINVQLEADIEPVTAGQEFRLIVTTEGALPEAVKFETVPNLVIDRTPSSQSRSTSNINGRISERVMLHYMAKIRKPSTIELPAATVTVDGKPYKTNPLTITAVEKVERDGPTLGDGVRINSFTDKAEAYEGEPIQLTLEIWELEGVSIKGMPKIPQTVGFYAVPQEPVATNIVTKQHDGLKYRVRQSTQMLYPTRSGQLQIDAFEWNGRVSGIAYIDGYRRRVSDDAMLASDTIIIDVKPLPERHAGFTGTVGSYLVEGRLSSAQVDQGVPVKLAIHVTGRGNPRAVSAPILPELDWAFVGEPVRTDAAPQLALESRVDQRFEFAITPHAPGNQTIPRMHFVYFDPDREVYESKGIGPFSLTVFASGETDRPVRYDAAENDSIRTIDILATDILPIVSGRGNLTRSNGLPAIFWAATFIPVGLYAGAAAYVTRRRRFERDHGYARAYHAQSEAHRELRGVLDAAHPEQSLHHALIQFVADTFNASQAGMTAHDADTLLRTHGCDDDLCKNVQTILRKCERAVYASHALPAEEMKALVHGAAAVIDQTKATARKGGTS